MIFTGHMTKPTVLKHWRKLVGLADKAWTTSTTPPCYNNTTLGNRLYAWRKGPNVTNPGARRFRGSVKEVQKTKQLRTTALDDQYFDNG